MAIEKTLETPAVKLRESTRRIECDCPHGGPNVLDLWRETAELDADGNVLHLRRPWRKIPIKQATEIGPMIFTRPDGSSFTGAQLMADMQVACDQIAGE